MSTRSKTDKKRSFWLALGLIIWVAAALGTLLHYHPEFWKDGYSYFKDARELAEQGKLPEAQAKMDKALERDPDNPGYLTFQGSLELKSGDETTAEKSYKRALALVPDNAEAALGLGELLLKQNRDKEALDTLDSLEAKALTNELLLRRARLQAQYGQHKKAIADFQSLLARTPENTDLLRQIAASAMAAKDFALAEQSLESYLHSAPEKDVPWAREQLIIALREQKKLEKAYALLTANPTPDNLRQRAELALELGRFNEAAPLFRTLLAQTPDDPELKNKFAIAIRALGGKEEAAQALAEAPTPENLDERAQLAMELQRFDEAAELYKELAKIHPDDPEIKNQLAVALRALKQRKQAYDLFTEAPTPENLDERAQLAMELQRFDEAAELYKELAKIHPDDPEIKNQLAVALRALKQRKQAYELFKEAPTPENLDERAQLAMELQRFDEAAELYKELAKIHPNDPEIKNQLAVALRALKQLEEAYKLFTEAPTPANLEARAELALQLKQYDDAARLYEELVALHPQNAQLRENLAYALDKGGQGAGSLDKAADQYAELIASGKASEETRVRYVWLLMREKRYDEAYQLLAAMPDTDPELLRLKAEAAFLSKRFAEAVPLLQQLSRTAPKDPEVWQNLAAAFDALKKPGEAAEALRQYLALAPADQGGSTRLAALLQRSGQTKEAIRIYKQILKTSPDDADALQGLATIYEAQSRYGAALDLLLRLARVQAPDAGLTLRIARLYKWKKEYATAQTWFRRALAMKLPGNERYLAVLDLAESELESGQGAEALRTLAALNPDKSKDPQLLELQARAAMADKKPARAVAALERLQRIRKLTATQQLWLAGQLRLLGENARALALYEALHKTGDLRSRDGLEALGDLRLDAGRAGDALRAYLEIPETDRTQGIFLKIARAADRSGDRQQAAQAYERFLSDGKPSAEMLLEAARFMIKAGKYARGLALYNQALQQRGPKGLELELAQANLAAKHFAAAERWADKAVATDPSNWKAILAQVQALHLQGKSLQADNLLQQHIKTIMAHPKAKEWLGYVAMARNRHLQAFRIFDDLLREGADDPGNLWLWRGVAATQRGDYARAEESFAQAKRFNKSGRPSPSL